MEFASEVEKKNVPLVADDLFCESLMLFGLNKVESITINAGFYVSSLRVAFVLLPVTSMKYLFNLTNVSHCKAEAD